MHKKYNANFPKVPLSLVDKRCIEKLVEKINIVYKSVKIENIFLSRILIFMLFLHNLKIICSPIVIIIFLKSIYLYFLIELVYNNIIIKFILKNVN